MLDAVIHVNPRVIFDFDDALFVVNPGAPLSATEFRWVKPRLMLPCERRVTSSRAIVISLITRRA